MAFVSAADLDYTLFLGCGVRLPLVLDLALLNTKLPVQMSCHRHWLAHVLYAIDLVIDHQHGLMFEIVVHQP